MRYPWTEDPGAREKRSRGSMVVGAPLELPKLTTRPLGASAWIAAASTSPPTDSRTTSQRSSSGNEPTWTCSAPRVRTHSTDSARLTRASTRAPSRRASWIATTPTRARRPGDEDVLAGKRAGEAQRAERRERGDGERRRRLRRDVVGHDREPVGRDREPLDPPALHRGARRRGYPQTGPSRHAQARRPSRRRPIHARRRQLRRRGRCTRPG